jgi:hypothetical protein
VTKQGPLPGAVGAISRFLEGDESSPSDDDVRREYADVAEGTIRSEQIPLTRRDYIRHYFEALRP